MLLFETLGGGGGRKIARSTVKFLKNLSFFADSNGKFSIIEEVYTPPLSQPLGVSTGSSERNV
jgi:hypothetical protein